MTLVALVLAVTLMSSPASAAAQVTVGDLGPGESVTTGATTLSMQADGNLVLYTRGAPVWHTRTSGNPGARFDLQSDHNLVVYATNGRPLWSSDTWGRGGGSRELRLSEATLALRDGSGRVTWRNGVELGSLLSAGESLQRGDSLVSRDRRYSLVLQGDGNLVVYRSGGVAVWSSATQGSDASRAVVQPDGNLVLYRAGGVPVWHTGTFGHPSARLSLQDDGNLVAYGSGRALWDSRGFTRATATHLSAVSVPSWALQVPGDTAQVVRSVPSNRWCSQRYCAVTQLWSKNANGTWSLGPELRSQTGPNGFSPMPRSAGDGTTPSGVFEIETTFSSHPAAPGPMPWRRRYPTSTVSGTAPYYNTWLEEPGRTDGTRPATEYGLWVDFNNARMTPHTGPEPDPAIGSGIFIHTLPAAYSTIPSAGCIAIGDRTQMLQVLQWLDPSKNPRIVFNR